MIAEMWKDALEGRACRPRSLPEGDIPQLGRAGAVPHLVPKGREHVADEILRKL